MGGTLAALLVAGCISVPPAPPFAAVWPEARERVDSLAAAGDPAAALRVLAATRASLRAPYAAAWQLRERDLWLAELRATAAKPPAERAQLAGAAAGVRAAMRASRRDSLAEGARLAADAVAIRRRILGERNPATARAELVLADVAFRLSRVGESDSLALAAESTLVRAAGPLAPGVALGRTFRGRSLKNYSGRDARPQAIALYESALQGRVAALGPWAAEIAGSWHEIGNLERASGRPASALTCFRMALAARRGALGPVHDDVASTLSAMAVLEASLSHWTAAESLAAGAIAASPPGEATPPMSRAFRLGVLGQVLRHNGHPGEAAACLGGAIALNERAWVVSPRDEGSTVQSGLGLHADLALALAGTGRPVEALDALERGTSRTLLEHAAGALPATPGDRLARIQAALPEDVALVTWVRSRFAALGADEPAWACVVRHAGLPHWVRLGAAEPHLSPALSVRTAYWTEMRYASRWPLRVPSGVRDTRLAREMGRAWFSPLEPFLAGVRALVVFSPDLVAGGPLAGIADSSGTWLVDRFAISYAPSATLYALARESRRDWPRDAPALVVGDPRYPPGRWAPLAGSRDEIAAVTGVLPGARVLTGSGATAAALVALAGPGGGTRYRLLHLAAHTDIDAAHLFESSLVLAPESRGRSDSRLSAREIAGWTLDADLVCLTGCRSASGVVAAQQGWLGFQQAFLRAGARSVLVSIWPVDDAASALLVREFYARLAHGRAMGSRAEALQGAMRAVRDWRTPAGGRPYAHPAYWAGFALIGDPG